MTTRREYEERAHTYRALQSLGFTYDECEQLRRISMTLQRWHELECGTGEGQVSLSVERENDDGTGRPFLRVQYPTAAGYVDRRYPIPDRENGAKKRLDKIMARHSGLSAFIQGDPRGAALYILRPGDVPEGEDAGAYYTRGICVY